MIHPAFANRSKTLTAKPRALQGNTGIAVSCVRFCDVVHCPPSSTRSQGHCRTGAGLKQIACRKAKMGDKLGLLHRKRHCASSSSSHISSSSSPSGAFHLLVGWTELCMEHMMEGAPRLTRNISYGFGPCRISVMAASGRRGPCATITLPPASSFVAL